MSDVEVKKPQVGEWWLTRDGKIRYVAADVSGVIEGIYPLIVIDSFDNESRYSDCGKYQIWYEHDFNLVEYLPDCTGWDWVPVEKCAMCGGEAIKGTDGCKDCTKFAIESTGCPVESPDDWVTQD